MAGNVSLEDCVTGIGALDQWAPALFERLTKHFGAELTVPIARAAMAILHEESRGRLNQIGDRDAPGGPSVGLMQVYRSTAKDLKLWEAATNDADLERTEYALLAADNNWCLDAGCQVLRHKWILARGDIPDTIRRYNGAGPKAEAYRDRVLHFMNRTWGLEPPKDFA